MSSIWTFSPSSESYFQRCIAAAPPPDINNKWFQKFGLLHPPNDLPTKNEEIPTISFENTSYQEVMNSSDATISDENFFDAIEGDSAVPVDYVLQKCAENPKLLPKLAAQISTNKLEQIFNHIFSKKDLETSFIYEFLPAYIKLQHSRLCIEILIKLNKHYETFKKLLEILMNDKEIPDLVLNNYVATLKEESITNFVKTVSNIELSADGLRHNLLAIFTAYKSCIKCDQIQEFIQKILIEHSTNCSTDRTFGRLFLTFLQTEKSLDRKCNIGILEKCLEVHRSPFKRPCVTLIKELS